MDIYTPPPSPPPRLAPAQRDPTRHTPSPRLKICRRAFAERPPTPTRDRDRDPSPELIFSMSPIESYSYCSSPPKATLNPGALLARARQQSANAFAGRAHPHRPTPRSPLLYSFPKCASHLRAAPITSISRANNRSARFSPGSDSSDDGAPHSPDPASHRFAATAMPIAVPLPIPRPDSFDSVQYSSETVFGAYEDDEESDGRKDCDPSGSPRPLRIVGFDAGTDSDLPESYRGSPFRFERFVPHNALSLDSRDDMQEPVRPLQPRKR